MSRKYPIQFFSPFVEESNKGGDRMIDQQRSALKSFMKTTRPFWIGTVLASLTGCSSLSVESEGAHDGAPQELRVAAQKSWEKGSPGGDAESHFTLAQAYSLEGRVDRAIEEYRAALAYDPDSAVLHAKLAAEFLRQGSLTFAIEECMKSLRSDPDSVEVRLMLGGIHSMNNESDLALAEYERVLKLDPGNDEAAVFKTQILVEKEKTDEALKFIRGFNSRVSDSAAAWFYQGKLEQSKGRTGEAVNAYRKAIRIRPGFAQAAMALGVLFEMEGQNAKAVEVYQAQLNERVEITIAGRLVTLLLKDGKTEAALKTLASMSAIDPEDLNVQLRIGLIRMQRDEWAEARAVFESILAKVPDSDKVHYYLAAVLEQEGSVLRAIEHLGKVSPDSKLFEDANLHAAGLLRRRNEEAKARELILEAIRKSPENPGFYLMVASISEEGKQFKEAAEALAGGLKLFPDHEKMRYFYGAMLDKLGRTDDAIVEMQKLLRTSPDHADALNFIAYTWTVQGVRLKDAEAMLKRAIRLKPENPFILDSFGWNQFMLGKNRDALIYLERAAGMKGDEEVILQHLAEVYSKNQMPDRERETRIRLRSIRDEEGRRVPASVESK